jgi:hypothetical protein
MNRLEQFACEHELRLRKDECGDLMISAKLGHIYEHGPAVLGVVFSESDQYSNKILRARRRQLVKAGLILHRVGDAESILLFDPTNAVQAEAVICGVGASRKRRQSAAQLFNLKKGPEKMPLPAPGSDAMVGDGSMGQSGFLEGSVSILPVGQFQGAITLHEHGNR